jgi:hypothetical protein
MKPLSGSVDEYDARSPRLVKILSSYCDVKITVFWDVTPCSPVEIGRRFRGSAITLTLERGLDSCGSN